jgi:hypothetical protein
VVDDEVVDDSGIDDGGTAVVSVVGATSGPNVVDTSTVVVDEIVVVVVVERGGAVVLVVVAGTWIAGTYCGAGTGSGRTTT